MLFRRGLHERNHDPVDRFHLVSSGYGKREDLPLFLRHPVGEHGGNSHGTRIQRQSFSGSHAANRQRLGGNHGGGNFYDRLFE